MRVALVTLGSLGDVYPFVALGLGLKAAGHDVLVVTHTLFEQIVRERGLHFAPVDIDPRTLLENEEGRSWLDTGGNALLFFRQFSRIAELLIRQALADCWRACQGSEAIVFSTIGFCIIYPIAEKLGVPSFMAAPYPVTPSRAFASPYFPVEPGWLPFGRGYYNRQTHLLAIHAFWQLVRPAVNRVLREVLDMPPFSQGWLLSQVQQGRIIVLYAYSPSIVPPPPDWGDWNHVTGYWFLDHERDWEIPTDLMDFLASGPAPVYIGFGSMNSRNPQEMTEIVLKALARSRQRGILLTGWGGLNRADLPENVFKIEAVPHDWLFPQVAAVVHHGGSGTTGAGLRAGIPTVIIPFFGDQPFWGHRVYKLGVGPRPIPRKRLSVERLADAISTAAGDASMRARAAALGEYIRAEDGVARAVEILERYLADSPRG
jgi:sterol 3beta-glucosyltransferase